MATQFDSSRSNRRVSYLSFIVVILFQFFSYESVFLNVENAGKRTKQSDLMVILSLELLGLIVWFGVVGFSPI